MTRLSNEELQKKISEQQKSESEDTDFNPSTEKHKKIIEKIEEPFDYRFITLLTAQLFAPINDIWFRPKFIGFDNFTPKRNNPKRPLIFAGNHSGMAFPWDAMVFTYNMIKRFDFKQDFVRTLTSPMLSYSTFMNPFQVPNLWKRGGAIDATYENFESMMHQQKNHIMIYPEGVPGIGKGFNRRYQLQQMKTSFVRMSVKYRTEIYPIYTINGEFIDPYAYSIKWINRLMNLTGIPFMAIGPITLLLIIQPWTFYIAFPVQLNFVLGKPIRPFNWTEKPYEDITQDEFREMADKIHDTMQQGINEAREKYGKKPFRFGQLLKKIIKNPKHFFLLLPFNWPIFFTEFERRYQAGERDIHIKTSFFHMLWYIIRNPITIAYYIPIFGWIPLAMRGFKGSKIKEIPKEKRIIK